MSGRRKNCFGPERAIGALNLSLLDETGLQKRPISIFAITSQHAQLWRLHDHKERRRGHEVQHSSYEKSGQVLKV
jgi:hypothetical protein